MISKLILDNFRNYKAKDFHFNHDTQVIFGNNGSGKTNILEAISLFNKGRGLRSSDLSDMVNNQSENPRFTIYGSLKNHHQIENCATSFDKSSNRRSFQVNGHKSTNIKNFPAIIWLTPKMDNIFSESKSIRRKLLDKIVCDIDQNHNSRINSYEKCLKERMLLLIQNQDQKWLEILERRIAELGVAIAIARNEAVEYLNKAILQVESDFIKSKIELIGQIEQEAQIKTSIEVEDIFCHNLKQNRDLDLQAQRSLFGVHRTDLSATLLSKNLQANFCSTGEQKSILIAITIARVRINSFFNLPKAILLLDEIFSHLDFKNRSNLFAELQGLDVQNFLTGTDYKIFQELAKKEQKKDTQFIEIK